MTSEGSTVMQAVDAATLRASARAREKPRRPTKRNLLVELDRVRRHRILLGVALATVSALAVVALALY
jgi:hypothetical protein